MMKLVVAAALTVAVAVPGQAEAQTPLPVPMVFMSVGDIWLSTGQETVRVTEGGGSSWPKLSPDKQRVAYLHFGDIWIAHIGDGPEFITTSRLTSFQNAGAPSWSPHGDYLAFRAGDSHVATLYTVRVSSEPHDQMPAHISEPPVGQPVPIRESFTGLREANTVAWSPNGRFIAFPGGDCFGIYDDCLTVLNLATNLEKPVAGWGGGGQVLSGYATTPAWSADSTKLYWSQQVEGGPIRVMAHRLGTRDLWQVGQDGDSIPVAIGQGRFLVVAADGWITFHTLNGRTGVIRGSQPDWQD